MVKSVVLDNSTIVSLFIPDESTEYAEKVFRAGVGAPLLTSTFMLIEFGNAMLNAFKDGRVTRAQTAFAHGNIAMLGIGFVENVTRDKLPSIHELALRCELTFYDALYLSLAMDEGAILATNDRDLRLAALSEGVELIA